MRHQQAPRFLISTIDVRIGGVFTAAGSSGPDHFLVNTQTGAHSHFPHNTRGWAETEPQHCIHGRHTETGDKWTGVEGAAGVWCHYPVI